MARRVAFPLLSGRLGRSGFVVAVVLGAVLWWAAGAAWGAGEEMVPLMLTWTAVTLGVGAAMVLRLHDLGWSGWWAVPGWLLYTLPESLVFAVDKWLDRWMVSARGVPAMGLMLIGMVVVPPVLIWLALLPGQGEANRFGALPWPHRPPRRPWVRRLAQAAALLVTVLVLRQLAVAELRVAEERDRFAAAWESEESRLRSDLEELALDDLERRFPERHPLHALTGAERERARERLRSVLVRWRPETGPVYGPEEVLAAWTFLVLAPSSQSLEGRAGWLAGLAPEPGSLERVTFSLVLTADEPLPGIRAHGGADAFPENALTRALARRVGEAMQSLGAEVDVP